jgi:hypothetical protein
MYCHVSGVCVTNMKSFGFDDRTFWAFIQLVKTVHKSLCGTPSRSCDWTLHGNCSDFQLNLFVLLYTPLLLLTVPSYKFSARTPRKTPSSVIKNACLLHLTYQWMFFYCLERNSRNEFAEPLPINRHLRHSIKC